tara:strand:+ start:3501 stop:10052 length:6552 start_codon:yes stop_codon:yes gene_type:complete
MIRTHLVRSLYEKLLGPENGPEETVEQPYIKYQIGILESCYHTDITKDNSSASDDKNPGKSSSSPDVLASVDNDVQWPDSEIDMAGSFSLGLSFVLKGKSPKIQICTTFGRYQPKENVPATLKIFKRKHNHHVTDWLDVTKYIEKKKPIHLLVSDTKNKITKDGAELWIKSKQIKDNEWAVQIFLVNRTTYQDRDPKTNKPIKQKETERIFQPQIRVKTENYEKSLGVLGRDEDENSLHYHQNKTKARGFQCSSIWQEIDPEKSEIDNEFRKFTWPDASSLSEEIRKEFIPSHIRTEYLPVYSINQPEASPRNYNADFFSDTWSAEKIRNDPENGLQRLVNEYKNWITNQRKLLSDDTTISNDLKDEGMENLDECEDSCKQIEKGIDFICNDERARLAFCFMNSVMSEKRKHDNQDKPESFQKLNWREFQMAFILQSLRGVVGIDKEEQKTADVLWFPTGGGKTEAYLGITAFAISYRRLLFENETKNQDGEVLNSDGGVCVISRYTLRLLTIQQFQRALGVFVVSDLRRIQNWIPKSIKLDGLKFDNESLNKKFLSKNLWGNSRFSIGMWIGGDATPTRFAHMPGGNKGKAILNAEGVLLSSKQREKTFPRNWHEKAKGDPAQVHNCPVCNNILCLPEHDEKLDNLKITWVIKTPKSIDTLEKIKQSDFEGQIIKLNEKPTFSLISESDDGKFFVRVNMNIKILRKVEHLRDTIDNWWDVFVNKNFVSGDLESLCSTSPSIPGYFFLTREYDTRPYDFVIHCTSADCELNKHKWTEGLPEKTKSSIPKPFQTNESDKISLSVPISAYTIDEQVYAKCPSFIIATADKFASLPWDPRCASLFGNVDCMHDYFGYGRRTCFENPAITNVPLLDKKNTRLSPESREFSECKRFLPPSLIIQDELHLIEGPLGSMVGVYEMAVDILSRNEENSPKYIASSATIKEASSQVGTIFRKGIRTFPRPGIFSSDNFFSKVNEDDTCTKDTAGRLYLGICSAKSTYELPIKATSIIMSEIHKIRENSELYNITKDVEKLVDPYWTSVSYFSDLQLMSRFSSFYGDDIERDVKKFSALRTETGEVSGTKKFPKGTRLVPIKSTNNLEVYGVSVYCQNTKGSISVALYDKSSKDGKLLWKSEKRKCSNGENPFFSEEKICDLKKDEKIWLAIINDSEETIFHYVTSTESWHEFVKNPLEDDYDFPETLGETKDIQNNPIRIELTGKRRDLENSNMIQLSSDTKSEDLPKHLEKLGEELEIDALLTSPVFGTGIDVDRLSLMNIMNQPKTTSGYIQASGRVGRREPGLVITWLRARRARDLDHYENFVGYHRKIHNFVEPVTANPFSDESLELGLGPIIVSILRNASKISSTVIDSEWADDPAGTLRILRNKNGDSDEVNAVSKILDEIASSASIPPFRKNSRFKQIIDNQLAKWLTLATNMKNDNEPFIYGERNPIKPVEHNVVLGSGFHERRGFQSAFNNTRSSMRDTEPSAIFYNQTNKVTIRPSQFMTRYGPGSLLPADTCSITAPSISDMLGNLQQPIGNFAETVDGKQKLNKIELHDSRMSKMLYQINKEEVDFDDIHIFDMPTNESLNSVSNPVATFQDLYKAKIFPGWGICSQHIGDRILGKLVYDPTSKAISIRCPSCFAQTGKMFSKSFANVRFVLACSDGHMSDVAWTSMIHRKNACSSSIKDDDYRVYIWDETGGGDNISFRCYGTWQGDNHDKFVETTCNAEQRLTDFKGMSNDGFIKCHGRLIEDDSSHEKCEKPAKFVLKSMMSLRSPINISSLVIRQKRTLLFEKLYKNYSDRFVEFILDFDTDEWTSDDVAKKFEKRKEQGIITIGDGLIADIRNASKEELKRTYDELKKYLEQKNSGTATLSEIENFQDELSSLENGIFEGAKQTRGSSTSSTSIKYPVRWISSVSQLPFEVMPYSDIRVTNVQTGYTREVDSTDETADDDKVVQNRTGKIVNKSSKFVDKDNNYHWYMGNQSIGEGIFIHLQPKDASGTSIDSTSMFDSDDPQFISWMNFHKRISEKIDKWLQSKTWKQHERDNLEKLKMQTNPLFIWWHSFAHQIISELAIDSGFTTTALNERVYCLKNEDGSYSAGVLIYVSTPGSDGTLGGLTSLAADNIISKIITNAENHMKSCSNDPVCSERTFNDTRIRGAACHCCLMSPETSCAYQNKFLDRNLFGVK